MDGAGSARVGWLGVALVATATLALSAWLTPSTTGIGTHVQLGLPPCGFYMLTGIPCPGCGLTTAFAHLMRLEIAAAASANPFGIPLFVSTIAGLGISLVGLGRGVPVLSTLDRLRVDLWALTLSVSGLVIWAVRVAVILLGDR